MIIIHYYILLYTVWHRLFYWDFRLCYTEILFTEIHYTEIQDIEIAPEILRLLRLLPRFWDYWDCSRDFEIAPEILRLLRLLPRFRDYWDYWDFEIHMIIMRLLWLSYVMIVIELCYDFVVIELCLFQDFVILWVFY